MRSAFKLVIGFGIPAVLSPGLFAATCSTWTLGNGTTTVAPGTSASGSVTGAIPCTLGSDTFNNFYVYNTSASDTDIVVGVTFTSPAVMTFGVTGVDSKTNFDIVFEVTPSQGSLTVSEAAATGMNIDSICSVEVLQGQTCAGQGGVVLGSMTVAGSTTTTITLAPSPTGNDWVFENVSGATSFSKTFTPAVVPEPISLSLTGAGLLGLGLFRRRHRDR